MYCLVKERATKAAIDWVNRVIAEHMELERPVEISYYEGYLEGCKTTKTEFDTERALSRADDSLRASRAAAVLMRELEIGRLGIMSESSAVSVARALLAAADEEIR